MFFNSVCREVVLFVYIYICKPLFFDVFRNDFILYLEFISDMFIKFLHVRIELVFAHIRYKNVEVVLRICQNNCILHLEFEFNTLDYIFLPLFIIHLLFQLFRQKKNGKIGRKILSRLSLWKGT